MLFIAVVKTPFEIGVFLVFKIIVCILNAYLFKVNKNFIRYLILKGKSKVVFCHFSFSPKCRSPPRST